jgi:hypothetical protein
MATNQPIKIQPRPNVKQINYIAKTFTDFRQNFIEFTKAYYPNTYADFNEASPGMMFIEMASYLGDVMSFYIDNSFKENLLAYAEQQENVVSIAQFLGYKPKLTSAATTTAELSIVVPAILVDGIYVPNPKFLPSISDGSLFSTNDDSPVTFRLMEPVDFSNLTDDEYLINEFDISQNPINFLVKKECKLMAGTEKTTTLSFGSAERFAKRVIEDTGVIGITDVVDSFGNKWYEVNYLAQDVVMDDVELATTTVESGIRPATGLRLRKVPRRFVTRINRDFQLEMQFGSGESNESDFDVLIDSRQIATNQYGTGVQNVVGNAAINNFNFLNSAAYGVSPSNVTLTVTYLVGGGVETNCNANTIVTIDDLIVLNDVQQLPLDERSTFNAVLQTALITNPFPATGGGNGESLDEIKENALAFFNAQSRAVTSEDYVIRTHAMPTKYGTVAKAYAVKDDQINNILRVNEGNFVETAINPTAINLYTLGYNKNKKLTTLNSLTKDNLARYLEQFRLLTDDVNILDAFVINIGVKFDITVFKNYNIKDVLARSIDAVNQHFNIDNWSINQPIILTDLSYEIGSVEGVQNVSNLQIFNKYLFKDGSDYQPYRYDIPQATVDNVIYPSLDPSIFELRYPETDIIGSAIQ